MSFVSREIVAAVAILRHPKVSTYLNQKGWKQHTKGSIILGASSGGLAVPCRVAGGRRVQLCRWGGTFRDRWSSTRIASVPMIGWWTSLRVPLVLGSKERKSSEFSLLVSMQKLVRPEVVGGSGLDPSVAILSLTRGF